MSTETTSGELLDELSKSKDALVDASSLPLKVPGPKPPQTLYHFTDIGGLIGILTNRTLWTSLATALNDQSESEYGLAVAGTVLEDAKWPKRFAERIRHYLPAERAFPGMSIESNIFVTSFCERSDLSGHWLHYGRSGAGFALGFEASRLPIPGAFELQRVVYDRAPQEELVAAIVDSVWAQFLELPELHQRHLFEVAAHTTAVHIRLASARFKNRCFENEHEWRLISFDTGPLAEVAKHGGIDIPVRYRHAAGRLVPYFEATYECLPLTDLFVGFSAPMEASDPGLALLLRRSGFGALVPQRSEVPVRP